ncbi:Ribosomal protein S12 methylthiotransferase RimO [Leclercia adecarboxylata]|uniref:Ribosomal protein S12 methylthiotransferase RimO n=1 Tax=Leclercia adecarboxylata TaxID=83655 RepID=A0A4U9HQL0_9ENTR|nr:Ribosomal protein S12 methylthiotransferase RimO [Leclercia adecarboxylata]
MKKRDWPQHGDAPEIDGAVYLNGETKVKPGDIVRVKVENATSMTVG